MNPTNDEHELVRRIAELSREMQPRSDLWPGIQHRIDPALLSAKSVSRPVTRLVPQWSVALAASLFVVFCVGMLLARPWETRLAFPAPQDFAATGGAEDTRRSDYESGTASESEYVAAFREFLAIPRAPVDESVPTEEWIGETRGVLRQTEAELVVALSQSPEDPLLQQRLAALRVHQLEWLKQMAAAERNSRRIST